MKAQPMLFIYGSGYRNCSTEEATHVMIEVPGPFQNRIIPVIIKGSRSGTGNWTWNGDCDKPTLKPSIKTTDGIQVCHSWVNDGKIQFLNDSTHEFAGKTMDLLELE